MTDEQGKVRELLRIDGLGGLSGVELPLSKVNVLIGPQASGKSLAAKLIYFCKSYPREMLSAIADEQTVERFHQKQKERLTEYFASALTGSFSIEYQLRGESLTIKAGKMGRSGKSKIEVEASEFFSREYATLRRVYGKQARRLEDGDPDDDGMPFTYRLQNLFYSKLHRQFEGDWGAQQIFVPSGRAYFSFLQGSIFSLLSNNIPLDPFIKEFGSSYERYKTLALRVASELPGEVNKQIEQILKGQYKRERGEDVVHTPDGRRVPISSSSSGQQEVLPLLVMLQYFLRTRNTTAGRSVYIEEPEAHLFPDTQKQLIELLVYILGMPRRNAQLVLTTHSPYVCAALNNLILAGDVVRELGGSPPLELKKITMNGAYMDFEDLSVLSLVNGKVRSVLDQEARLIDTRYLDSISEEIVHQREALLDLEEGAQSGA